jgi:cytochrome c-type biogenesis protein CcmH
MSSRLPAWHLALSMALSVALSMTALGAVAATAAPPPAPPATPVPAPAVAQPLFADVEIEARLTRLSRELRCVVCQNEALVDSPAELAGAMRQEIRDLMKAGKTDQEVLDFLTARYGDFVLFRPPLKPLTYLLWAGPFLFLALGGLVWFVALRARRSVRPAPVNDAQLAAAARLLDDPS